MTVAEGGGRRAVLKKFQDVYVPALKANYIVWPAVQVLNFRVMPIQFQIVSTSAGRQGCYKSGLIKQHSRSSQQWVSLGLPTSPSPTPPMKLRKHSALEYNSEGPISGS